MGLIEWSKDLFADSECKRVWGLVEDYLTDTLPEIPKWSEVHISECQTCKIKFMHLVDKMMYGKLKNHVQGLITCDQCGDYTDQFIDRELEIGFEYASKQYPSFILHIVHCNNCFELYWITRDIVKLSRDKK